jgi:hypothetical protein
LLSWLSQALLPRVNFKCEVIRRLLQIEVGRKGRKGLRRRKKNSSRPSKPKINCWEELNDNAIR